MITYFLLGYEELKDRVEDQIKAMKKTQVVDHVPLETTLKDNARDLDAVAKAICKKDGYLISDIQAVNREPMWWIYRPHAHAAISAYKKACQTPPQPPNAPRRAA